MLAKIIGIGALAAAIIVTIVTFSSGNGSENKGPAVPDVKFTEFSADRQDIKVGEKTKILFNVQSTEPRAINNSRVDIVIEPSSYQPYLSIDKPSIALPLLEGKDSRSGQREVTITANSSPAKEAVYTVKGVIIVEGQQTDIKEFALKISQE